MSYGYDSAWMNVAVRQRLDSHPPLYKFLTVETAKLVLQNGTLRWSRPGIFNDPFDTQLDLYMPPADEEFRQEVARRYWDTVCNWGPTDLRNPLGKAIAATRGAIPILSFAEFEAAHRPTIDQMLAEGDEKVAELHRDFREFFANTKILCLTSRLDSVQMWSHYAQSHTGVALEFRSLPSFADSPWRAGKPVRYSQEMPLLLSRDQFIDFLAGRSHIEQAEVMDTMIYTKGVEWTNENEWRISTGSGRDPNADVEYVPFNPWELASVIIGIRTQEDDRRAIVDLVRERYPHATLEQAVKARGAFRIEIAPLL